MARLLRDEARARTRARLIAAAEKVFADKGFAAATLEEIAEAAGYTRGALYYNFADKDELFVAVLEHRIEAQIPEIAGLMASSDEPGTFFTALRGRDSRRPKDALRWALLSDEFWLYAARNPKARAKLAEHHRHLRAAYAAAIRGVMAQLGIEPPAPVEHLAAVIFALDHGLPRQAWIDPDSVSDDLIYDVFQLLIEASVALDGSKQARKR